MITFLKNLFFPSVTSLTSSVTKTADRLDKLADRRAGRADALGNLAQASWDAQQSLSLSAYRARTVASKFRNLVD